MSIKWLFFVVLIELMCGNAYAQEKAPTMKQVSHKTISARGQLADAGVWTEDRVRLVAYADNEKLAKERQVTAKTVYYQTSSAEILPLSIVANPAIKRGYVVRGEKAFYLADGSEMYAGMIGFTELILTPSFAATPMKRAADPAYLQQLSDGFDEKLLLDQSRDIRIGLFSPNVPDQFWTAASLNNSQIAFPTVASVEFSNGLLKLELNSDGGVYHGLFLVDLKSRSLVSAKIEGSAQHF